MCVCGDNLQNSTTTVKGIFCKISLLQVAACLLYHGLSGMFLRGDFQLAVCFAPIGWACSFIHAGDNLGYPVQFTAMNTITVSVSLREFVPRVLRFSAFKCRYNVKETVVA